MKRLIFFPALVLVLSFAGCDDKFLDRAPEVALSEEQVFSDPVLTSQFADNAYNFLVDDYARLNDHRGITGQFSDEAVSSNNDIVIRTINNGDYHAHSASGVSNDILTVYNDAYRGIRVANTVLVKLNDVPFTNPRQKELIAAQTHFLRAFFYYELIKRFGGVILIDKVFGPNEDINLPKSSFEECVDFILKDLDAADGSLTDPNVGLPLEYEPGEYGRATKGASYALRSKVLLLSASPLHNPSDDKSKWLAAANAAKRIMIDLNQARVSAGFSPYTLSGTNYDDILNLPQSNEYIMIKPRGQRASTDGRILDFSMSPGSGGQQGTLSPTQNHVDLYEMKTTGLPIADPKSGYNPQKPYEGRDPRFYSNIIYNDRLWQGRRIDMYSQKATAGYDYIEGNTKYTATGYYSRKMWPEVYKTGSGGGTTFINFIFFRYAEVLLNYAEAQNEALSAPDQSVRDAVNMVRTRVGMPPLPDDLDKDGMRARIRNERAVELAFEDIRWFDILRWRAKELITQPMMGMKVSKSAGGVFIYTPFRLPDAYQKVHASYMDLYPFPRNEVYKSSKLIQNPQW